MGGASTRGFTLWRRDATLARLSSDEQVTLIVTRQQRIVTVRRSI